MYEAVFTSKILFPVFVIWYYVFVIQRRVFAIQWCVFVIQLCVFAIQLCVFVIQLCVFLIQLCVDYLVMSVYRSPYYAFLFFIQLWLVAIQLLNIDPILIDHSYLSPQKHRWIRQAQDGRSLAVCFKESVRRGLLEIIQKLNVGHQQYHEADYFINWIDWKQSCVSMPNLQISMIVYSAVFQRWSIWWGMK